MKRQLLFAAICSLAITLAGCGGGDSGSNGGDTGSADSGTESTETTDASQSSSNSSPSVVEEPGDNWAELSGTVTLKGEAPSPKVQTQNLQACKMHSDKMEIPIAEVGENKGVKNVFVWLEATDGSITKLKSALPPKEVTVDQKGCEFLPDSAILSIGGTLTVKNSDAGSHNFKYAGEFIQGNITQEKGAEDQIKELPESPQFVTYECNIHPWMGGVIRMADHHANALTGSDGSFSLGQVAPGEYKVKVHHKALDGPQEKGTVTVTKEGKVEGLDLSGLQVEISG